MEVPAADMGGRGDYANKVVLGRGHCRARAGSSQEPGTAGHLLCPSLGAAQVPAGAEAKLLPNLAWLLWEFVPCSDHTGLGQAGLRRSLTPALAGT